MHDMQNETDMHLYKLVQLYGSSACYICGRKNRKPYATRSNDNFLQILHTYINNISNITIFILYYIILHYHGILQLALYIYIYRSLLLVMSPTDILQSGVP